MHRSHFPPPRGFGAALTAVIVAAGVGALLVHSSPPSSEAAAASPGTKLTKCTRYAAPWGQDDGRGTKARPFNTVQRLADSLRPGETGCLRRGVYTDTEDEYVLTVKRGGTPVAPIRIRSQPGERGKLVGVVYVRHGSDYVVLSHLDIEGPSEEITFKVYSTAVFVEDNDITNRGRGKSCMILGSDSDYGQAVRTIVRRNIFHECGSPSDGNKGHGIYAQNVVDSQIIGNVFWSLQGYAIQFYTTAQRNRVAHNVIDGGPPSVRGGIIFGGSGELSSNENVVEQNVIAYAASSNITSGWDEVVGKGNIARRNCLWAAQDRNIDDSDGGFSASGNVVAPPHFINRSKRDYRLKEGSRCLRVVGYDAAARLRFRYRQ